MAFVSNYPALLESELAGFINPATGAIAQSVSQILDCPVCEQKSEALHELFLKRGYRFVLCPDCGLIFANPLILPELSRQLYESAPSLNEASRYIKTDSQLAFDTDLYCRVFDLAGHGTNPPRQCLDISMRAGLAAELDFLSAGNVDFLDFCRFTREIGQARHPLKTFFDSFDSIEAAGRKYDLVISMEAIEQFPNPVLFMQNVAALLNEGGIFCGVLSNVESLLVRLLGADAPLFDGLYQKFFFHTGSLSRLFSATGFGTERFDTMIPCTDRIKAYLNRLSPTSITSSSMIEEISHLAERAPLGYKLLFSATKAAAEADNT